MHYETPDCVRDNIRRSLHGWKPDEYPLLGRNVISFGALFRDLCAPSEHYGSQIAQRILSCSNDGCSVNGRVMAERIPLCFSSQNIELPADAMDSGLSTSDHFNHFYNQSSVISMREISDAHSSCEGVLDTHINYVDIRRFMWVEFISSTCSRGVKISDSLSIWCQNRTIAYCLRSVVVCIRSHFVTKVRSGDQWWWYDGLVNSGIYSDFLDVSDDHKPVVALYSVEHLGVDSANTAG
jgi:hypothetical protein